eukprot:s2848_g4.t1
MAISGLTATSLAEFTTHIKWGELRMLGDVLAQLDPFGVLLDAISRMGCGASSTKAPVDFDPLHSGASVQLDLGTSGHGDEIVKQITLRSWTAVAVPGVPSPPNRDLHVLHMRRMVRYMRTVKIAPEILTTDVEDKRLVLEILSEQTAVEGR